MSIAKRFLLLVTVVSLIMPNSFAATKTPTAKPKIKVASKAPTASDASTATTKKIIKKKPVYKAKPRRKVNLKPRKDVAWPPIGFENKRDVYAKVPNARQVLDAATTDKKLRDRLNSKICDQNTCGAVMVAAEAGCVWWEITGDVIGPKSATDKSITKFGRVRTLYGLTIGKEIKTILIVSGEPRKLQTQVVNIDAICHTDNPTEKLPSESYEPVKN